MSIICTTTPSVEGKTIEKYLGIVSAECILGANVFKDLMAGFRDVIGGRSRSYENELRSARLQAMEELQRQAISLQADAIVGIDLDFETLGRNGSMLMVCASGTAVKFTNG